MKNLFTLLLLLPTFVFSQSIIESLDKIELQFQKEEYKEAIASVDIVKVLIENVYLNAIKKALLPESINDFLPTESTNSQGSSYINGDEIQISQTYINEKTNKIKSNNPNNEEFRQEGQFMKNTITISISNLPSKTYEIGRIYMQKKSEFSSEMNYTPFVYEEYRTVISYDEEMMRGHLMIAVGSANIDILTSRIEKESINDILKLISINDIIKCFGK